MFLRSHRRAKIVATVGPASSSPSVLKSLYEAGVDTFRLNFSHGERDQHAAVYRNIRAMEKEFGSSIGILQDLQGPKIRLGTFAEGPVELDRGAKVRFVCGTTPATGVWDIPLPHSEIFRAVSPGDDLLIDDGRVRLRVTDVDHEYIGAFAVTGGTLSNRKGVNVPGAILDISPLTTKDRKDLEFGMELGVDWVALSFVQKARDIIEARALVSDRVGLVAKIEKPSALNEIEDIIRLSDAVMVARGDLGVEIPPEEVPARQKEIIRACRMAAKPVIVATQMLDSMVTSPTPTRAEASDVAGAIYDGADAVMLSAESATGAYPVEAVTMMDRIIEKTEQHSLFRPILEATDPEIDKTPSHAVAAAAAEVAKSVKAPSIVAFTVSGATAARIARSRPAKPILAITETDLIARRLTLMWGVISSRLEGRFDYDRSVELAKDITRKAGLGKKSDHLVIVAGFPFATSGGTNNLRVTEIGSGEIA